MFLNCASHAFLPTKLSSSYFRNEPDKFGHTLESIRNLEKILLKLESVVLEGNMMKTVLNISFDICKALVEELSTFVKIFSIEVHLRL